MLMMPTRTLPQETLQTLADLQTLVDAGATYQARVELAKSQWNVKTSSNTKRDAFDIIKSTLQGMCVGRRRCAYCEDSLADEIEHILPKTIFPDQTFQWSNYLYACGPCNGPKGNRYGTIAGGVVTEFIRLRNGPVNEPPMGLSACIDPRRENPMDFLELDLGGQTQDGDFLEGTFYFVPMPNLDRDMEARAAFSIDVLTLNRESMRDVRRDAFGGFRARMREYVEEKRLGAPQADLNRLRDDLLGIGQLTVFAEMQRQRSFLPQINALFIEAPEMLCWKVLSA